MNSSEEGQLQSRLQSDAVVLPQHDPEGKRSRRRLAGKGAKKRRREAREQAAGARAMVSQEYDDTKIIEIIATLSSEQKARLFEWRIRCNLDGTTRWKWEVSKTLAMSPVLWLSPEDAKGLQFCEICLPLPGIIRTAWPEAKAGCPEDLKNNIQGRHWAEAFVNGEDTAEPLVRALEDGRNFARDKQKGESILPRRPPKFVALTTKDYSKAAAAVISLGYPLEITKEGTIVVIEEEPVQSKINAEQLVEAAKSAGAQDLEAMHAVIFGAKSFSKPPMVCSVSAPHASVYDSLPQIDEKFKFELKQGWIEGVSGIGSIPCAYSRLKAIPKKMTDIRLLVDTSYPWKEMENSSTLNFDGTILPIAPNFNAQQGLRTHIAWTSIEEIALGAEVVGQCAHFCNVRAVQITFDYEKWFRQLPRYRMHQWMCFISLNEVRAKDNSLGMGQHDSADWGQRISLIISIIALDDLDKKLDGVLLSDNKEQWCVRLREYRILRLSKYDGNLLQARPYFAIPYQDDMPVVVIEPLLTLAEASIRDTLKVLGIALSGREKPGEIHGEAIGAKFSMEDNNRNFGPLEACMENFKQDALKLLQRDVVSLRDARHVAGLQEWINHFYRDGAIRCWSAHRCIAFNIAKGRWKFPIFKKWRIDLMATLDVMGESPVRPLVDNPRYQHGIKNLTADASTLDGWGLQIGPFYALGLWDEETLSAIARSTEKEQIGDKISISPLELWIQAILSYFVGKYLRHLLGKEGQFVARCDSSSACTVVDTLRPKSVAMAEALTIKMEIESEYVLRGRLEHLAGEENVIPDHLSHGRIHEAVKLIEKQWGRAIHVQLDPKFVKSTLVRVCTAIASAIVEV